MEKEYWTHCETCRAICPSDVGLCPECLLARTASLFGNETEDVLDPYEEYYREEIERATDEFRELCEQETGSMDLYASEPTADLEEE